MIILYRHGDDPSGDDVQEALEELVLAHRVVEVDGERPDELPADIPLPALVEGDDVYAGEEIDAFLERRGNRLKISRQMSADACFLDPDDPEQCI